MFGRWYDIVRVIEYRYECVNWSHPCERRCCTIYVGLNENMFVVRYLRTYLDLGERGAGKAIERSGEVHPYDGMVMMTTR